MIEHVESLQPELHVQPLGKRERARDGGVDRDISRSRNDISSGISELTGGSRGEGPGVEPVGWSMRRGAGSCIDGGVRIPNQIGAVGSVERTAVIRGGVCYGERAS